ncbi:FAR1-related sequence 5 [Rhynchospora pubera]|uniref:FAR1-related sequence 5 n=1 Tax=Rhynchospora pubera TaxID=906938 RepID=A0AAV8FB06_9POAL|nr:FAR1-related sequence 5 [Rhynchospora pubera]
MNEEQVPPDENDDIGCTRAKINDPYIDVDMVFEEENNEGESIEIYVGKEFKSPEEAYNFYNLFALIRGFSIRKNHKGSSRKGVSGAQFVCSKQGLSDRQKSEGKPVGSSSKPKTPEKKRSFTRTNCKAYMRVKLVDGGIWRVSRFNDEHNHLMVLDSPSKKRGLRSQRCLTMEDKQTIRDLNDQNVGPSKIAQYLSILKGGRQNVLFRTKDVSNVIGAENKKYLGVDIDSTLLHFQKKKEVDSEFFYAVDADEDGFVRHIFWAEGRSRRAYLEFGDVVTFDTTYNTNKYSMPLAPFIGVNHHRQSIFFGMALLRSENTNNFVWLFETWLKAMYGKHPRVIITDQDPAMKNAIEIVFPDAVHRCCQWHVMRKAREKLGSLYGKLPTLAGELGSVINCSLTVSEFEDAWTTMLDKYELHDNRHLKNMFAKREEWAPAYFRGFFFAEMTTTQRSESMNALFKMWVTSRTSIYKFVCKIDNIIENIWQTEGDEDMRTMNEEPQLESKFPLELDARRVYTRKVFSVFKELIKDSSLGVPKEIDRDTLYEVTIKSNPYFKHWRPVTYLVNVDKEAGLFSCNCKGFEFDGLLCSHALIVMWMNGVEHIPAHYILNRWCRNANAGVKRPMNERSRDAGNTLALQMFRATTLKNQFNVLVDLASKDVQSFNKVEAKLRELVAEVQVVHNESLSQKPVCEATTMTIDDEVMKQATKVLHDPPISKCKGRKKRPERWKIAAEKAPIKGRMCRYCKKVAKHNIRTCPKKKEDEGKGKKNGHGDGSSESYGEEDSGEDFSGEEDSGEEDDSMNLSD